MPRRRPRVWIGCSRGWGWCCRFGFGEGSLEIAVCAFGSVDQIAASYRNLSTELDWVPFWESSATLWLDHGDVFADGVVRGVEIGDFTRPELPGGSELDISFLRGDAFVASAVLKVPDEGLPAEEWLHPDGSVHAVACSDPGAPTDAPEVGADEVAQPAATRTSVPLVRVVS
jgi:hypothetical protein